MGLYNFIISMVLNLNEIIIVFLLNFFHGGKCIIHGETVFCRNATIELLTDSKDGNSRSRHSNNRRTAFENLALSVEQDGQALNEVSSFHTGSFCSQHEDRLQVSVVSPSSTAEVSFAIFLHTIF